MNTEQKVCPLAVMAARISFLTGQRDDQAAYVAECAGDPWGSSRHESAVRILADRESALAEAIEARAAVVELVAAVGPVVSSHNSMATVKGRLEMQRRLNTLRAALAKFGGVL